MSELIIRFDTPRIGYGRVELRCTQGSGIPRGVTAAYGRNGSGKSTLGIALEKGRYAFGNRLSFFPSTLKVKLITFSDIHSLSGMEVTYHHQRMEATMNDYVPTVAEVMKRRHESDEWQKIATSLGLQNIAEKKINYLSSGELRKLLISNALSYHPDLLILDNPYIGLDKESRTDFNCALEKLKKEGHSILLLLTDPLDIPPFTDNFILIENLTVSTPRPYSQAILSEFAYNDSANDSFSLPDASQKRMADHKIAFQIRNGHAEYGDKVIFRNLDWTVRSGECWRLSGRNGSGKSLLMSMICADNPQAYSNDITLFDRKRGSGESIFDIKDNIGYVSPEMHLYFRTNDTVEEVMIKGLRNALNCHRPGTPEERAIAQAWLEAMNIAHLQGRKYMELSQGEQRLILVARAMIGQPPLLLLDEPFHGLDPIHKERLKKIINALMTRNHGALIFVTHYDEETPECVILSRSLLPG
ncbi:MAG: ATP-binding cassette domain-containing protein [Muribaculaceae bacterium]|nr:ATP-binding cassette domain-containing protein [Muribaculaceae bacterium]